MRPILLTLLLVLIPATALAQPVEWPVPEGGNGHFYELVPDQVTAFAARDLAEARIWNAMPGHLATLTSPEENEWCHQQFGVLDHGYIVGGYQFPGSGEPADGWNWVTDEEWSYTRWGSAEPNNTGGIEDCLIAWFGDGSWNDGRCDDPNPWGYLVEYEPEPVQVEAAAWGAIKALFAD